MSEEIQIDKGILLPAQRQKVTYPFDSMEIGDSFAVPYSQGTDRAVRFQAGAYGRVNGKRFTVRRMKEESAIRCWRVQ